MLEGHRWREVWAEMDEEHKGDVHFYLSSLSMSTWIYITLAFYLFSLLFHRHTYKHTHMHTRLHSLILIELKESARGKDSWDSVLRPFAVLQCFLSTSLTAHPPQDLPHTHTHRHAHTYIHTHCRIHALTRFYLSVCVQWLHFSSLSTHAHIPAHNLYWNHLVHHHLFFF